VQGGIVVRADRRRDSTLSEVARRRLERALREHDHVGSVRGAESSVETRDPATDDEEIAFRLYWSPSHVSNLPLLVFASESITDVSV
jgi:hypothetical protein